MCSVQRSGTIKLIKYAFDLIIEHETNNPFEIADVLGVNYITKAYLSDGFKGLFISDIDVIVLNKLYSDHDINRFHMAHELYHALEHRELEYYYHYGHNIKNKYEYEANLFAIILCLFEYDPYINLKLRLNQANTKYIPDEMMNQTWQLIDHMTNNKNLYKEYLKLI